MPIFRAVCGGHEVEFFTSNQANLDPGRDNTLLRINFISSSDAVRVPTPPLVYDAIASNSYSCYIWVFFVGADLTDHLCGAYFLAVILRDILISDNLECFCPGDALFSGYLISFAYALS